MEANFQTICLFHVLLSTVIRLQNLSVNLGMKCLGSGLLLIKHVLLRKQRDFDRPDHMSSQKSEI